MKRSPETDSSIRIIDVVVELLMSDGYDDLQLKEVARRAQVSLATVYKKFATRDEMIVAAVTRWMAINSYAELEPPAPGESLRDGLVRVIRHVFEPWERNPRMLEAYHRARRGVGGRQLDAQGVSAVLPVAAVLFEGYEAAYVEDIGLIITNMIYALTGRFVDKELEVTEILPMLERAIDRLTSNSVAPAASVRTTDGSPGTPFPVYPALAGPYGPDR
ncbi:TetR family transcriptional regulator [Nocardia mangyaensis]|uniref:TetR family transcriptional regulator n=1 Tax=Nocardia mangyaensis TaxID=2213200 RepID=A0A1J0VUA9_9NOCA|nr:TetR family transcriptional regulator [Nocardia mangyaensis]APE35629.1 TetR family transcriptional regulator [Nocardia mangyaensis]